MKLEKIEDFDRRFCQAYIEFNKWISKTPKKIKLHTAESTTAVQPPDEACTSAKPAGASQLLERVKVIDKNRGQNDVDVKMSCV